MYSMSRATPVACIPIKFGPFTNTAPMRSRLRLIQRANPVCSGRSQSANGVVPATSPRWTWLLIAANAKHRQSVGPTAAPSIDKYVLRSTLDSTNHSFATKREMR